MNQQYAGQSDSEPYKDESWLPGSEPIWLKPIKGYVCTYITIDLAQRNENMVEECDRIIILCV